MKVSASFLSSRDLVKDLRALDLTDVDYIHLDIMDGKFVNNKTMPYSELKNIYKYTSKRLDVHLMVEDPEKYIPLYATLNTEYIVFHVEVDRDITKLLKMIKQYGIKAGLSIKPNTKVNELVPYLPYLDMVLVMSVEPGKGGQTFIEESEERIKEVRELLKSYNIPAVVNVDGGVNDKTISKCRDADIVTAGSYIIGSDNFQTKISSLR
jgi:ribulose-phosphate 3-epimerase